MPIDMSGVLVPESQGQPSLSWLVPLSLNLMGVLSGFLGEELRGFRHVTGPKERVTLCNGDYTLHTNT